MNFGIFLLVLFPALLVSLVAKFYFHHSINWKEFGIQVAICTFLVASLYAAGYGHKMHDVQILSGKITDKKKTWVSCEHSYQCNCSTSCSTDSQGNQSCSTVCQTCYEHSNDWDWRVHNDVDGSFNIDRIDRRGVNEPPRFTAVKIGEPYATSSSYVNYVKAVPESLFNTAAMNQPQFASKIPKYPEVYDYYRINRVITVGVPIADLAQWNAYLSEKMVTLGKRKQANVNIVFVNTPDQTYRYALEAAWLGGKKNDVTVIIGMTTPGKFDWVDTITFGGNAGNSLMTVLMRDRIMALTDIGHKSVIDTAVATVTEKFDRKPMKDFEYLKSSIIPPDWCIYTALIVGLILSIGCSIFFHRNEV